MKSAFRSAEPVVPVVVRPTIVVRGWQSGDLDRLARAGGALSEDTLHARFWAGMPTLPPMYLRSIEKRWPDRWDAVVALTGDALVGWAEYGRNDARDEADLGICVVDAMQGVGVGATLLRALLRRCTSAGLTRVYADIGPANRAARALWHSVVASTGAAPSSDPRTVRQSLVLPRRAAGAEVRPTPAGYRCPAPAGAQRRAPAVAGGAARRAG